MTKSKRKKPSAWLSQAIEIHQVKRYEGDMGCDWSEAHLRCWRCGCERTLQACHIVPRSLGGADDASNLIGLCFQCHDEMPNVTDAEAVWDWIRITHASFYDVFWRDKAMELAQRWHPTVQIALARPEALALCKDLLRHHTSLHFRQSAGGGIVNTVGTLAWVYVEAAKRFEAKDKNEA